MDEFVSRKIAEGYDDSEILAALGESMMQGGQDGGA